jgi:hypothetical protein
MKKLILAFFFFTNFGCFYNPTGPAQTELGKEFELRYGQKAVIGTENLYITFENVVEDSRCPIGYQCVWAGNGAVLLKIGMLNSNALTDTVNTTLEPQNLYYHMYNITLKGLKPYPVADSVIKKKDYIVTLLVGKIIR